MATIQTTTALREAMRFAELDVPVGKRKFQDESVDTNPKKRRAPNTQTETTQSQLSTTSPYYEVCRPLLTRLGAGFEVKTMSVLPSTSISKHVERALEHLGRFSAWDQTVSPGVVLLCAKSAASNKLITISEVVRRRIAEAEQKWFQYNVLSETVHEEVNQPAKGPSVVKDTIIGVDTEQDPEEDYFETIQPTVHERAVKPVRLRYKAYMIVLLSRVRLDELKGGQNISLQTNEQHVEYLRKKKMGLVG
ncbi:hypothetical protein N656DRAFT_295424 [Canariomyces notabilis]|uniref:DNA/RNA-binding protein Alba-like domain-containing protein n=1 Tax=Canariomyces notabilis TaxID=2074819 RepID=A0AAN6QGZ2_9PEZI|nr:hypothetical protein N656DRAFT_295424 [Canariomyces arenarius]